MKKLKYLFYQNFLLKGFIVIIFTVSGCKKKEDLEPATIQKICAKRMMLSVNNKIYEICNVEKVSTVVEKTPIQVKYAMVADCPEANSRKGCKQDYFNNGWVEILEVK